MSNISSVYKLEDSRQTAISDKPNSTMTYIANVTWLLGSMGWFLELEKHLTEQQWAHVSPDSGDGSWQHAGTSWERADDPAEDGVDGEMDGCTKRRHERGRDKEAHLKREQDDHDRLGGNQDIV